MNASTQFYTSRFLPVSVSVSGPSTVNIPLDCADVNRWDSWSTVYFCWLDYLPYTLHMWWPRSDIHWKEHRTLYTECYISPATSDWLDQYLKSNFNTYTNHWRHNILDCLGFVKLKLNKKVLLRERKRHTARRVASTPYVVLTGYPPRPGYPPWQGTPPARVPPWPGYPGYPPTRVPLPPARVPPQPGYPTGQGTPPPPTRVPPSRVPPHQGTPPARVPPPRLDLAG